MSIPPITQFLPKVSVPTKATVALYRKVLAVFYIEERMKAFTRHGKCSFWASCRGHEVTQLGVVSFLRPGHDWFFPYYRSKGTVVGVGLSFRDIFLGMLSREGDPSSGGRNMPEHFSSRRLNLVSRTACVGSQFLPAVGVAKAVKAEGTDAVVYVESGDGAASEGEFFEALNWASREKLPMLFVIQNNGYAISVPQRIQTASSIRKIAEGFGIHAVEIDGTSYECVYETAPDLIRSVRQGNGPVLIEAKVVRLDSHSSSDDQRKYRSEEELRHVAELDPLQQMERWMMENKTISSTEIEQIRREIKEEVDSAANWADAQPGPDVHDLCAGIYAEIKPERTAVPCPRYVSEKSVTFIDAINHGLSEEMQRNPKIVMWGEDIADPKGGVFGVTRGLRDMFGERVSNSPLAEASIVGVAGGMALAGYKPIVEIQFADYLWPAAMQLRNEIPTVRWRSDGAWTCPVVVRIAVGGYIKGGPWHSTCVESFFSHIPGWRIVFPSCAEDAKGLIKAAARSQDPVIFLEHKSLYRLVQAKSLEPDADYVVPFGRGRILCEGTDATIVTWGITVYHALEVARQLQQQGKSVEVLDLRSIIPFDEEMIYESVRKTNRIVIAHEDSLTMGFGAELAARIAANCIDALDAPVLRVTAKDSFVPSAPALEALVLPSVGGLRAAIEQTLLY
ncbi:dehydrogenase E1 component subunit alpha/beta [Edaphobacter sp. DSM 109919]|uniref:Dehydrogenase E1 component subunit alpha/beta n=1 Tax=Edaphobacter paludis TaxID=3035702 RepID=A0AAU7D257_9BACT